MTIIRNVCASMSLILLLAPFLAHADARDEHRSIQETLSRYQSALNAADANEIAQLYTVDGVMMAPDAPAAVGRDAIKASYGGLAEALSFNLAFTVDEIELISDKTALLRSHSKGTVKVNGSGQAANEAAFKELFVLEKQNDGRWKFTHYSFSSSPLEE
ncbi:SgcJ/EcaC family oxidoreductase [Marinimicrobium sp. C6131]|uniref:YybH family protein n=1 Tax=Marinimicrobium sp. C6131 TaxID=3022676 RepID=UPI00223E44E7|nr:SgcJ/EcaC family oxidoreductase [Marinimicrobium sp. C6131]UZJ43093.1 SgcJ/EcaC family oxidoreductase [Marinimicrobium sp. C6131]